MWVTPVSVSAPPPHSGVLGSDNLWTPTSLSWVGCWARTTLASSAVSGPCRSGSVQLTWGCYGLTVSLSSYVETYSPSVMALGGD